ncbi:LD-carboxypeptidase [Candidatus Berkelbacteria bacterium]|nr:LD-carboxypeptidase [Candidatus Berkelbacteria bacterium]
MIPQKLKRGDIVAVIAPSRSLAMISQEIQDIANQRFTELGLTLTFGKHVQERDEFESSNIEFRIQDLHAAFTDSSIKAILTVIGGFNSNQLLRYIDWDLLKDNPKIFCGYSDITALNNAIFTKTGLVSYSGPHYSAFGEKLYLDYTLEYFKKCLMSDESFAIEPAKDWSDDFWWKNQDVREPIKNDGWLVINEGKASGTILGGNLCTFNLLHGTEYFPPLDNSILFIEDDEESMRHHFDRDLQSIIHLPDFHKVKGLVIGRFQKASKITNDVLTKIIKTKKELNTMPIIANVDFGHTSPMITFPIGGELEMHASSSNPSLNIIKH